MASIKVMGSVGHWELRWTPEDPNRDPGELEAVLNEAEERFVREVEELGGTAFVKNEAGEFEQVYEFNPDVETIIVPRVAGG